MNLFKIFDATRRQKEQILQWATKAGKDGNKIIQWIEENFKSDADQFAAGRWLCSGYDPQFFKQALYICAQKKMDPMKQNPSELVQSNPGMKPKEKPIDPSKVLTDPQDEDNGIVSYAARDEDMPVLRQIINTHYGVDANPWCLLQGDNKGNLTENAHKMWERYDAYPKRIAFLKGKLLAFSAGNNPNFREWWDRYDRSFPFVPYDGYSWVGQNGAAYSIRNGEVFREDEDTVSRLNHEYSSDIEHSFSDGYVDLKNHIVVIGGTEYPYTKDGDNYVVNTDKAKFTLDKDLKKQGYSFVKAIYNSGEGTYKNDMKNGPWTTYRSDGSIQSVVEYKNDKREGNCKVYNKDGSLHSTSTFKNGNREGLLTEYRVDGTVGETSEWKAGKLDGTYTSYFEDGKTVREVSQWKADEQTGWNIIYDRDGNIEYKQYFNEGYPTDPPEEAL